MVVRKWVFRMRQVRREGTSRWRRVSWRSSGGRGRERIGWRELRDSSDDVEAMLLVAGVDLCRSFRLEMVVVIRMFTLRECVCAVDEGRVGHCALC